MPTLKNSKTKKLTASFMRYSTLERAVKYIFPDAILTTDSDGEIIILTGYKEKKDGRVRAYDYLPKKV